MFQSADFKFKWLFHQYLCNRSDAFVSHLSLLGHHHGGLLFTSQEQRRHGLFTSQEQRRHGLSGNTHFWCTSALVTATQAQNASTHSHVFATLKHSPFDWTWPQINWKTRAMFLQLSNMVCLTELNHKSTEKPQPYFCNSQTWSIWLNSIKNQLKNHSHVFATFKQGLFDWTQPQINWKTAFHPHS